MMYWIIGIVILLFLISLFEKKQSPVDELFGNPGEHLSFFNKGFSPVGGLKALTVNQSFRHMLITSSTGGGKTSGPIVGSLFTTSRSPSTVIIFDPASECYKLTSGFFHTKRKRKIYCFNPLECFDGFNPITHCRSLTDLDKVAHVLIKNSGVESKSDQYWSTSAELVLSCLLQYVFFYCKEEQKNMSSVILLLDALMAEPGKVDLLFVCTKDARLLRLYKTIVAIPEKTRQSILSTVITATKLFRTPEVARCTSVSTFKLEDFRKEPSILYLCIPLHMINFLAPLIAVLFEMFFQESLSKIPDKGADLPIYYFIDEMLSMRLDLPLVFSQGRKYKIGVIGIVQSMEMLPMKYSTGECFAIKSNANCIVHLPGQTIQTCRELQELIGKAVIKDETGRERQVYGMEAAQIRTSKEAILLINTSRPIRLSVVPFFKHFLFNARTKIPPYIPEQKIKLNSPIPQTIEDL